MTDMLKKAALAACEVTELYGREEWVVRAVLRAMRDADQDLRDLLLTSMGNGLEIWTEAIDAILAQPSTPTDVTTA